ncbi:MAG: GNAT family N-acetyltransferase [Polyangiales bacterium]
MALTLEIRPLRPTDDRSDFRCGEAALDRFFQHYAGQNQFKLRLSVTYVATLQTKIVGFVTVSAGSIEGQSLPSSGMRRRRLPAYPLPVLRVARLGVTQSLQRRGIGRQLLRHALKLSCDQRDGSGCVGVVTDAKPDAVPYYAALGFVPLEPLHEGRLHGDWTPMFLDIRVVAQSLAR